jgi:hypothetical protein
MLSASHTLHLFELQGPRVKLAWQSYPQETGQGIVSRPVTLAAVCVTTPFDLFSFLHLTSLGHLTPSPEFVDGMLLWSLQQPQASHKR